METTPEIVLRAVYKSYGKKKVLDNLNMDIASGEFITAIGSSGCGKTTVLKLINGLLSPDSGQIFVGGQDITMLNQNLLRRKIGYVIQGVGLFPHLRVKDNISYVLNLSKTDESFVRSRTAELMEIVNLDQELLPRYPHELSGGQKQRVGIARALAANPQILLMDEPFGAVDDITRKVLQDEIKKIQQEFQITIFFITHDIAEALKLGSRVMVMDKGQVEQFDTPGNIHSNPQTAFVRALVSENLRFSC